MSSNNIRHEVVRGEAAPYHPDSDPSIPTLIWRWVKNAAYYVLRFYLAIFLLFYHWCVKIVNKALEPFQPIANEVRKVPKKDISVKGIFYQFLRLQFLVLLFLSPFVMAILNFIMRPLVILKDKIVRYLKEEEGSNKPHEPTELNED